MYYRLESWPVTTTRPAGQILPYPLTKSAVLPSQISYQAAFPRPTVFIPSSRSSSHSSTSGSSPEFSLEDTNPHPSSVAKPSNMASQHRPSLSQRALLQGRPLPQVPPLSAPPTLIPHPTNGPPNSTTILNLSPIISPSSPTALHRPKRALPIIPPSPHTPQMTGPSHLSSSPAIPSVGSSDVHTPPPQFSPSVEPLSKLHVNLSIDLSPTTAVIHHLPPLRHRPKTRVTVRRVNAEASSSKVQLPPRSPVSLDDLISPVPPLRPKLKVQTPSLTRTLTDHPSRGSLPNDRPKLRIRTPSFVEPSSAPFDQTTYQRSQNIHPLPHVPHSLEPARGQHLPRRSSLDSLTTRSSALLDPEQALSPYISRRPRSRKFLRDPQQDGFLSAFSGTGSVGPSGPGATETRVAGRGDHNVEYADEMEGAVSPMQFTREGSDGGHDDIDFDRGWDVASPGTCNHPVVKSPPDLHEGVVLENTAILLPTADEVIGKRLGRIRRRHGETVIRELDVDPRSTLEKDKGKSRAQGVGRFVLSEGEEGETDDEDDFYPSSSRAGYDIAGDYQNYVSDDGYRYGHEQSQDIHEQPRVYGDPHAVMNAYEHRQAHEVVEDDIDDEDSDPDALGDAGNKTPAARFPPGSVHRTIEIEDEMVFEKSAVIFDDLDDDDDDEHVYREKRIRHNASSIASHEPVSSGGDLALSRKIMKHMPLLSGTTYNQNYEKVGAMHSASSSSSSFITPPPSGFMDQGFQQAQNAGPTLSIKKLGRILFKEKGGQEVADGSKKLT